MLKRLYLLLCKPNLSRHTEESHLECDSSWIEEAQWKAFLEEQRDKEAQLNRYEDDTTFSDLLSLYNTGE